MALNDAKLYYSFDDADNDGSGNPQDLSGNDNHGTNNGATTGATGVLNEAFDFDDSTAEYVTIPNALFNSDLKGSSAISVSMWIKKTKNNCFIFEAKASSSSTVNLYISPSGKLRLGGRSQSGDSFQHITGSTTLSNNTLYHITAIFDYANDKLISYINDVEDINGSVSFGSSTYNYDVTSVSIATSNTSYKYDGLIDEAGIWNKTLSSSEVSDLYNSGDGFNPYASSPDPDPEFSIQNSIFKFGSRRMSKRKKRYTQNIKNYTIYKPLQIQYTD